MTEPLVLEHVSADYGSTRVLEDLSLSVKAGELVSLLGSSGCGKTTTLRLVAGFLVPSAGRIQLGASNLTQLPTHRRNIGLVFQNYALFPHLTVIENVAFGLKQRKVSSAERLRRAGAMLEKVNLQAFANRLPAELSGGQKQRVALARALAIEPPLLMFDEPLSNLDAKLRVDMRVEIRQAQQQRGTTAIYVTHDQEEAFSISDRVAIMNAGRILQLDTPEAIYKHPVDAFVANFVGFDNMLDLRVTGRSGSSARVEGEGGLAFDLPFEDFGTIPDRFVLAIRSEGLLAEPRTGNGHAFTARSLLRTYLGRSYQYQVETAGGRLTVSGSLSQPFQPGEEIAVRIKPEHACILPPR
jgi:putative spermidine/putrescine transport system ATP-binding protein